MINTKGALCPCCGGNKFRVIGKPGPGANVKKYIRDDYYVVQCDDCSLYYVSPGIKFSDKEWEDIYKVGYFSEPTEWLKKKRVEEVAEKFDRCVKLLKKEKIDYLDVGAGEGLGIMEALKRGWNVTAIDITDHRVEEAKTSDVEFILGRLMDLALPENSFDFVYFDSVLEHVLNPLEHLREIKRILKPGGIIYIGVPNEDSLFNDVKKLAYRFSGRKDISVKIKPFDSPYHVIGFNKKSIKRIIQNSGLGEELIINFGRKCEFLSFPPFTKSFFIALLFLFPVELIGLLLKRDVYYAVYLRKK